VLAYLNKTANCISLRREGDKGMKETTRINNSLRRTGNFGTNSNRSISRYIEGLLVEIRIKITF
jgi:hypothetical protein